MSRYLAQSALSSHQALFLLIFSCPPRYGGSGHLALLSVSILALPWDRGSEAAVGVQARPSTCATRGVPRAHPGSLGFGTEIPLGDKVFLWNLPAALSLGALPWDVDDQGQSLGVPCLLVKEPSESVYSPTRVAQESYLSCCHLHSRILILSLLISEIRSLYCLEFSVKCE